MGARLSRDVQQKQAIRRGAVGAILYCNFSDSKMTTIYYIDSVFRTVFDNLVLLMRTLQFELGPLFRFSQIIIYGCVQTVE